MIQILDFLSFLAIFPYDTSIFSTISRYRNTKKHDICHIIHIGYDPEGSISK